MAGKRRRTENVDSLARRLASQAPADRADAVEKLGALGGPVVSDLLRRSVRDRSPEVRMRAIEAWGRIGGNCEVLIDALVDRDELVRVAAAESLDAPGSRKAARALRKTLRDRSALVRSYAATALGRTGFQSDRVRLRHSLSRERSDGVRLGILEGLWLLGDRKAFDEALQLVNSSDYRVRCATAGALAGTFLSRRTRPLIVASLVKRFDVEETRAVRSTITSKNEHGIGGGVEQIHDRCPCLGIDAGQRQREEDDEDEQWKDVSVGCRLEWIHRNQARNLLAE
jgi:HEAT repeat protein